MSHPPIRGGPPSGEGPNSRKLFRIHLKSVDQNQNKPPRGRVLELIHTKLKAYLTGLRDTQLGYMAITDDPATIDNLTTAKGINELKKLNLEPTTPPEIRARRTIFVRQLDQYAGEQTPEAIKAEIEKNHPWLKAEVHKIKTYTHVIKLVCDDSTMADRILRDGLTAFYTRITSRQCELEKFTHLKICFKCYKYESHGTGECKSQTVVCSECAEEGHNFKQCQNDFKRCLNCPEDSNHHRTLAAACPAKKAAIRTKESLIKKKLEKKENSTYANIVQQTLKETKETPRPQLKLGNEVNTKLLAIIFECHVAAITTGEKFNDMLSEQLKRNYNIDAKFPDRDSQKILDTYMTGHYDQNEADVEAESECAETKEEHQHKAGPSDKGISASTGTIQKRQRTPTDNTTQGSPKQRRSRRSSIGDGATATLPPLPQKQRGASQTRPMPLEFKLFRSRRDPKPIPENVTCSYVIGELLDNGEFGLRLAGKDSVEFFHMLRENRLHLRRSNITTVEHAIFTKYPRNISNDGWKK